MFFGSSFCSLAAFESLDFCLKCFFGFLQFDFVFDDEAFVFTDFVFFSRYFARQGVDFCLSFRNLYFFGFDFGFELRVWAVFRERDLVFCQILLGLFQIGFSFFLFCSVSFD